MEVAHELEGLRRGFTESRTRIEAYAPTGNSGRFKHGCLGGEILLHLCHYIVVRRVLLHGRRLALHVHDDAARIARCGHLDHSGIAKARNVVDDGCAGLHASACNLGMTRIDADAHALFSQGAYDIDGTREFFFYGYGSRAWTGRLPAHVDNLGTRLEHCTSVCQGRIEIVMLPAVRKRIGSDVKDAHNNGHPGIKAV